ncbi:hypothetical protein RvY_15180 [Ramazzottius varieornatus]|uniref:Protein quiver n=1 Tax=Ramazzottius varieornatus TaxID=947166 RepID=A0A1D1VU07_RAMVA|nr:hypothetical protein RvY_15180 [Ramazzottius varieornatus]
MHLARFILLMIVVPILASLQAVYSAGDFQCYVCFPDGGNLQQCNEPNPTQLAPCPARPDGSHVCWMTMREDADKSLIVTRGCGRALEAPTLRNNDCKKTKDKSTGVTEQICNCDSSRCNRNDCRKKSKCFL